LGALVEASAAAEDDDGARVVVLAARGPAFSLGLPRACRWPERSWPDGVGAVAGLTKPVIAAIQGAALGWGLALALACDLRLASTTAVLALPALGERRFPGGGVTQRLPRMIGTARAMEVVLLRTLRRAIGRGGRREHGEPDRQDLRLLQVRGAGYRDQGGRRHDPVLRDRHAAEEVTPCAVRGMSVAGARAALL